MKSIHLSWLLLLLYSGLALADEGRVPMPTITKGRGDTCVEPTAVMRRAHMGFLLAQRDQTMRFGVRGGRHSLSGCVDCHVNRDDDGKAIPVDAPGQFCADCHRYAGVEMDCFGCHASTPESGAGLSSDAGVSERAVERHVRPTSTLQVGATAGEASMPPAGPEVTTP